MDTFALDRCVLRILQAEIENIWRKILHLKRKKEHSFSFLDECKRMSQWHCEVVDNYLLPKSQGNSESDNSSQVLEI